MRGPRQAWRQWKLALGAGSTRPRLDLDSGTTGPEYTARRGLVLGKGRGQNFGLRGTRLAREGGGASASGSFWLSLEAAWRRGYELRCSSEMVEYRWSMFGSGRGQELRPEVGGASFSFGDSWVQVNWIG